MVLRFGFLACSARNDVNFYCLSESFPIISWLHSEIGLFWSKMSSNRYRVIVRVLAPMAPSVLEKCSFKQINFRRSNMRYYRSGPSARWCPIINARCAVGPYVPFCHICKSKFHLARISLYLGHDISSASRDIRSSFLSYRHAPVCSHSMIYEGESSKSILFIYR